MSTEAQAVAPPVVAVVVTCDAGPWLEETLAALRDQDYPNLAVLVVDAGSTEDPTPRVASVLPGAYVRRVDGRPGFAAAANEVLQVVEGASHYLFCHDDVAPDPDAVRLLVEEAFRSNAGIVAPKLVSWDDPARLLQVGMGADKSAAPAQLVEPGELDQEQHDAVRDVFVAPGGCTLVRADLFAILGGFDPEMTLYGEDLDLSWRAQVAGARVIVAPGARVRHLEAMSGGLRGAGPGERRDLDELRDEVRPLQLRHRLRAVLKNYSLFHLVRVLPQLALLAVGEVVYGVVSGRVATSRDIVRAWRWNFSRERLGQVRRARKALRGMRLLPDGEVRRLQSRGSARMTAFVRGQLAVEGRLGRLPRRGGLRHLAEAPVGEGTSLRLRLGVFGAVTAVVVLGSRHLLTGEVGVVHELVPFPDSPLTLLHRYMTGWRFSGLGSEAPAPPAFALLGLAGTVLFGAMALLRTVVIVGALPLGLVGMFRLTAPLGSLRPQLVGLLVYAAVPLPYNALARGRWSGLLAYAAFPWLLARLLRATGLPPFGDDGAASGAAASAAAAGPASVAAAGGEASVAGVAAAGPGSGETGAAPSSSPAGPAPLSVTGETGAAPSSSPAAPAPSSAGGRAARRLARRVALRREAVPLGLMAAVLAAFVPSAVLVLLLVAAALALGGLVAGGAAQAGRAVGVAAVAVGVAVLLLFPWSLDFLLPGSEWAPFAGVERVDRGLSWGELLRFETGPLGAAPLGWAFVVAPLLPLLIGRDRRLAWATRAWTVALVCWTVAWVGARGWAPVALPPTEVLLAPAAAALALATALGMRAFERDLPRYRFGWRQTVSLTAAAAALLGTLPVLGAVFDGRWHQPTTDFRTLLSWMEERPQEGDFRVLWLGAPAALPAAGRQFTEGVAYGTSDNGFPDVTDLWPSAAAGAGGLLADALDLALDGETTKLGHLLAPAGVRYLVVPLREAPSLQRTPALPPPPGLLDALDAQVDLAQVESDPSLRVYRNAAWIPVRARLGAPAAAASRRAGAEAARSVEATGSVPALADRQSATRYEGDVPDGSEVYLAEAASGRWSLEVDGRTAPRRDAFGWANAWTVEDGGRATLRYRTSPLRWAAVLVQLALWVLFVRAAWRHRRRRADVPVTTDDDDSGASAVAPRPEAARRPSPALAVTGDAGLLEEDWE